MWNFLSSEIGLSSFELWVCAQIHTCVTPLYNMDRYNKIIRSAHSYNISHIEANSFFSQLQISIMIAEMLYLQQEQLSVRVFSMFERSDVHKSALWLGGQAGGTCVSDYMASHDSFTWTQSVLSFCQHQHVYSVKRRHFSVRCNFYIMWLHCLVL